MQITKKQVDDYHIETKTVFPLFELVAEWQKDIQQIKPLDYTLEVEGTTQESFFFKVMIDPGNYCVSYRVF